MATSSTPRTARPAWLYGNPPAPAAPAPAYGLVVAGCTPPAYVSGFASGGLLLTTASPAGVATPNGQGACNAALRYTTPTRAAAAALAYYNRRVPTGRGHCALQVVRLPV